MRDKTNRDKAQGALVSTVVLAGVPVLPDTEIEAPEAQKHSQQVTDIEIHRWSLARRAGNGDGEGTVEKKGATPWRGHETNKTNERKGRTSGFWLKGHFVCV